MKWNEICWEFFFAIGEEKISFFKLMVELSAKVNLEGLGFQSLTNILITVKKLILLIKSFDTKTSSPKKTFFSSFFWRWSLGSSSKS